MATRLYGKQDAGGPRPKSMTRPKVWTEEVEEAYRFQLAGYRDETEYLAHKQGQEVMLTKPSLLGTG